MKLVLLLLLPILVQGIDKFDLTLYDFGEKRVFFFFW